MTRAFKRHVTTWGVLFVLGCSTGQSACAGCVEPIEGGFPTDPQSRSTNAMTAKLSPSGVTFFESSVNDIIQTVAGDQLQNIQVGCLEQTQVFDNPLCVGGLCVGDPTISVPIFACDHNRDNFCSGADNAPPVADSQQPLAPPLKACQASTRVNSLKILPTQPSAADPVTVKIALDLRVNTGTIPVSAALPLDICTLQCAIELDSNTSGADDIPVDVEITLTVDPANQDVLGISIGRINLNDIFDPDDLLVRSNSSGLCSQICRLGSIGFVKDTVFNLVKGTVESKIYDLIDTFRCRPCEALTNNCPTGSQCVRSQGVCYSCTPGAADCRPQYEPDSNIRVCPPASLGLEGRVGVGEFLAAFGAPSNSMLDLYAVAGGRSEGVPDVKAEPIGTQTGVRRGIQFGIMGGTRPVMREQDGSFTAPGQSACVPLRPWAPRDPLDAVDFTEVADEGSADLQGTGLRDFHFGLSLSDNFLDKSFHDAYAAGLLCLNVDSSVSTFLSSSLFRTFLPSLGVLTQGQDVPMLVALRPKQAPEVTLGLGTTKVVNGERVPDDPLLTIDLKQVQIDFYALVEERQARLFSLTADIRLPLSLEFNPSLNTVRPVLADLETVVTNIVAANSEMLHEDPRIVADLITAIIGLVQPVLASVLAPVELPTFNGFKLEIRHARGTKPMPANATGFQHLALLADLKLAPQAPLVSTADTEAKLVDAFVPSREALLGESAARPKAVIEARGAGVVHREFRGYEYSYRVDGGLWSPWLLNERLEVRSPVLLFAGRHDIDVRAREIDGAESEDLSPARVAFVVDYDAPSVRLELDAEQPVVRTLAADEVSRADELVYRYRVGAGGWSADGSARAFTLAELGANPALEVEVVDTSGHVGKAQFGSVEFAASGGGRAGEGCQQAGAGLLAALGLAFVGRRRRS
jgi:hypothetical protein